MDFHHKLLVHFCKKKTTPTVWQCDRKRIKLAYQTPSFVFFWRKCTFNCQTPFFHHILWLQITSSQPEKICSFSLQIDSNSYVRLNWKGSRLQKPTNKWCFDGENVRNTKMFVATLIKLITFSVKRHRIFGIHVNGFDAVIHPKTNKNGVIFQLTNVWCAFKHLCVSIIARIRGCVWQINTPNQLNPKNIWLNWSGIDGKKSFGLLS